MRFRKSPEDESVTHSISNDGRELIPLKQTSRERRLQKVHENNLGHKVLVYTVGNKITESETLEVQSE